MTNMVSVEKPQSLTCTFCLNMGIAEPHDHTIRDFTNKNKQILCPKLLTIECGYCHQVGHTKNYCSVLKEKKLATNSRTNSTTNSTTNSSSTLLSRRKRHQIIDNDGFVSLSSNKVQNVNNMISAFGGLDVAEDNDSTNCDSESDYDEGTNKQATNQPLWTEIVYSNKNKEIIFATPEEIKDQLGIKCHDKWGDD